ncbi:LAMI_0C04434g1_1 [Lachancea mirantina]|uniref:LAMI_0C04434g1_1 n=1 Tax=Lachancea mirantina TaxID=1230905 RepID=A0A1G4J2R2_9SACH|nr:LAMI_0C04434g1_1 [Lachancea mirantina]
MCCNRPTFIFGFFLFAIELIYLYWAEMIYKEDLLLCGILVTSFYIAYNRSYQFLWNNLHWFFDRDLFEYQDCLKARDMSRRKTRFQEKLHSEYAVESKKFNATLRSLFSLNFGLYLIAIEMTLLQIKNADIKESHSFASGIIWPCISAGLMVSLIFAQPYLICLSVLSKFLGDRYSRDAIVAMTSTAMILWVLSLNLLNFGPFKHTQNLLTKLSIVGVSVMAFLSGVASVSTPFYAISSFWRKYKTHARAEFNSSADVFTSGRKASNQEKKSSKLKSKVIDNFKSIFKIIFLFYCIYKLYSVFFRRIPAIIKHVHHDANDADFERFTSAENNSPSDPLAVTLAKILDFLFLKLNYQQELDSFTKLISLILSVSLFACSFTTVLTTVSYLITVLPLQGNIGALRSLGDADSTDPLPLYNNEQQRRKKPVSIIKNFVISELTGVYVSATILMIRSNLPFDISEKLNELLGKKFIVPSILIDIWFDQVFAISAVLTLVGIRIAQNSNQKSKRLHQ